MDNIFTNCVFDTSLKKGIIKTSISDHFAIFAAIILSNENTKNQKIMSYELHGWRRPWENTQNKQKLYIKFLKSKNPEDKLICKNGKSLFEKLRKKSKQNYYSNLLEKHKGNLKQRWQVLKEITGKVQRKYPSLPTALETEKRIISEKKCFCWRIQY